MGFEPTCLSAPVLKTGGRPDCPTTAQRHLIVCTYKYKSFVIN